MINGCVMGIVEDNRDPDGLHRVMVRFPVDDGVKSSWCRMLAPMGGGDRGLVMLPDIGTEVLLAYAYRSMTPFVLGALYNGGQDRPETYRNDDGNDDKRVFWSRADHLVVFDDTAGAEQVGVGACAPTRLRVTSAPVHHVLDAAKGRILERCAGTTMYQATGHTSIRCRSFSLKADDVMLRTGSTMSIESSQIDLVAGSIVRATAPDTQVKTGSMPTPPRPADRAAPCKHPPRRSGR
jgi:uncharacterized protein involved in type VI secretion and phage assembly